MITCTKGRCEFKRWNLYTYVRGS